MSIGVDESGYEIKFCIHPETIANQCCTSGISRDLYLKSATPICIMTINFIILGVYRLMHKLPPIPFDMISHIHGTGKLLRGMNGEDPKYNGLDVIRAENDVQDLLDFDNDGDVDLNDFSEAASSILETIFDFFS
jgi:hypothetical protein